MEGCGRVVCAVWDLRSAPYPGQATVSDTGFETLPGGLTTASLPPFIRPSLCPSILVHTWMFYRAQRPSLAAL